MSEEKKSESILTSGQLRMTRLTRALLTAQDLERAIREALLCTGLPGQLTERGLAELRAKDLVEKVRAYLAEERDAELERFAQAERAALAGSTAEYALATTDVVKKETP